MIACTDCLVFDVVYYLLWWLLNLQLSRIPTTHYCRLLRACIVLTIHVSG